MRSKSANAEAMRLRSVGEIATYCGYARYVSQNQTPRPQQESKVRPTIQSQCFGLTLPHPQQAFSRHRRRAYGPARSVGLAKRS
jgi:hypothetical protein